jgi:hypothetical protein
MVIEGISALIEFSGFKECSWWIISQRYRRGHDARIYCFFSVCKEQVEFRVLFGRKQAIPVFVCSAGALDAVYQDSMPFISYTGLRWTLCEYVRAELYFILCSRIIKAQ